MGRVAALVMASVVIGGVAGAAASAELGPFLVIGLLAGLVTGLVLAPILVLTLRRKRLPPALAFVALPTLAIALLSAFVGLPPAAWLFSVATLVLQCVTARWLLSDVVTVGRCVQCKYDLSGLAATRCPECGAEFSSNSPERQCPRWALVFQFVGLLVVLFPLALLLNHRRTPRDIPSLVERLGENDMELSNRAQHELMRRDPAALVAALSNPNPSIRGKAVQALGWLGDPSTLDRVRALENDPDPWVSLTAKTAVQQIKRRG